jgi:hypothetical protein
MTRKKRTGTGVFNNITGEEITPEELAKIEEGGSFARRMMDTGHYSAAMTLEEADELDAQPWPDEDEES